MQTFDQQPRRSDGRSAWCFTSSLLAGRDAVADIAFGNKAAVYDLFYDAASKTMLTVAADPHHLGALVGLAAVLNTWNSALTHHFHLHMIVLGGGLSPDGTR